MKRNKKEFIAAAKQAVIESASYDRMKVHVLLGAARMYAPEQVRSYRRVAINAKCDTSIWQLQFTPGGAYSGGSQCYTCTTEEELTKVFTKARKAKNKGITLGCPRSFLLELIAGGNTRTHWTKKNTTWLVPAGWV